MVSTYVITGASRGIGLEFVKQLSARGDIVFACVRNPDTASLLKPLVDNKKVHIIKLDVNNASTIKAAAEEISKLAPEGIDILINNAGISPENRQGTGLNTPREDYMKVFETNVCGVADVTQAIVPLILKNKGNEKNRKIVNISSILGSNAEIKTINAGGYGSAYCVSKAALNMLTTITANNLRPHHITVYASHPGWVQTEMGGQKAPVQPEESVKGQLARIDSIEFKETGGFFDYNGKAVPF
ncbi:4-dihydrotrisporin dehydrogenase [Pilobolus umbonatus]|nr:4-dihydrotrisporin dehydrogenase [Pilobolus umbonatus]